MAVACKVTPRPRAGQTVVVIADHGRALAEQAGAVLVKAEAILLGRPHTWAHVQLERHGPNFQFRLVFPPDPPDVWPPTVALELAAAIVRVSHGMAGR